MLQTTSQQTQENIGVRASTGNEIPLAFEVSLVIPTRNEEQNLPILFGKLRELLAETNYEIIVIDDSDDATATTASRLAFEMALNVTVIHRRGEERAGGLSTAVLAGVAAAYGDYVCIMDADLQHPPELVIDMISTARETDADIVVSSRYIAGGSDAGLSSGTRRLISKVSKGLVKAAFHGSLKSLSDPLSGFFLARRTLLCETALRPIGFKILLDILVRSNWKLAAEVPLQFQQRSAGSSKATFSQGRDFLSHVMRLFWEKRTRSIRITATERRLVRASASATQGRP
ncbi:MAG: polyprenol monophosphomannose synthase [Chloroflexota bacterium]